MNKAEAIQYIDELEDQLEGIYDKLNDLDSDSTKQELLDGIEAVQAEISETLDLESDESEPEGEGD